MRVLLPLRKAPTNKHASNSSLSDQSDGEEAEALGVQSFEEYDSAVLSRPLEASAFSTEIFTEQEQQEDPSSGLSVDLENYAEVARLKTGGEEEHFPVRKRRPADDFKLNSRKKRSLLDTKPPPREIKSNMGGGRRIGWRYDDDEIRDNRMERNFTIENNPESARGDVLPQEDQNIDFVLALKTRGLEIREQEGD